MLPASRRALLIAVPLLIATALVWAPELGLGRTAAGPGSLPAGGPELPFLYFLDVEGWYRITPYETVVRSPYDLGAGSSDEMARRLPDAVGDWRRVGRDRDESQDPAVVDLLKRPSLALSRVYRDSSGALLTLTLVGHSGDESFLLFVHTPDLCYPFSQWQVLDKRRDSAPLDDRPMWAQYLLVRHQQTGQRLAVLYFYLWTGPQRDPRDGVLSLRVNLTIPPGASESAARARAWDFVRALFPSTVPWDRF